MSKYAENLSSLGLFLIVCVIAFIHKDFSLFESVNESIKVILGNPPPAFLISTALAVYLFSAMVLTLSDIVQNSEPKNKWSHLFYRITFFIFYSFGGTIALNFIPVLLVGLFLYGLEQFHILHYEKMHLINIV